MGRLIGLDRAGGPEEMNGVLVQDSDRTVRAEPGIEAIASLDAKRSGVSVGRMGRATRSGRREGGWRESNPQRQSQSTSFQSLFRSVLKRWKFGCEEELVGQQDGKGCAEGSRSRKWGF